MAAKQREKGVPFFRSIQTKYALTYLLVVAAILIVMNTYPLLTAENMVFQSKEDTLKRQALVISSTLAVSETLTRESVEQTMALLEEVQGTRVLVTDASGLILYDSSTLDNRLGDYALTGEVAAAQQQREADRLTQGSITLDLAERAAWRDGAPVDLTAQEFDLMVLLMQNPGRVYSRENLLNLVWGYEYIGEFRTVDVHIRRLREKLEPDPANPEHILTKWGVGYYLANNS